MLNAKNIRFSWKFNVDSSLRKFYFKNIATEWFKDIDSLGSGSQEM